MRYAAASIKKELEEEAYRAYVTDALKGILKRNGGDMEKRWYDVVHPPKQDPRTGDEIAMDVIRKLTGEEVQLNEPT